jgi:hypothetical protein
MQASGELPFERFRYWQGQAVRARDFRDQAAVAERQAEWHNRAIHGAFGVRSGFEVTLAAIDPPLASIACGLAFDCAGAMLVLQQARVIPVPRIEPGSSVTLRVRSRHGGRGCGTGGSASGPGAGLLEADLVFTWSTARHANAAAGVPLARISRQASTELDVDTSIRVLARPLARPRLGSGSTSPGLAPWEPWPLGMQTRVDTSAAGFTRIPGYFAVLTATRQPEPEPGRLPFLFKTHITDPGLTSFTLRVMLPERLGALMVDASRAYGLSVCWFGAQEPEVLPAACPGHQLVPEPCATGDFGVRATPGAPGCGCGCHGG